MKYYKETLEEMEKKAEEMINIAKHDQKINTAQFLTMQQLAKEINFAHRIINTLID